MAKVAKLWRTESMKLIFLMLRNIKSLFFSYIWPLSRKKLLLLHLRKQIGMSKTITHEGIVVKIEGSQVSVLIVQHSACSGCHARGACTAADQKEKIIVAESGGAVFGVGERVMLVGSNSMAWSALAYAFIIPLVLCMAVLFLVGTFYGEGAGAVAVLFLLVSYYAVLFAFRNKLKTKFTFIVHKVDL